MRSATALLWASSLALAAAACGGAEANGDTDAAGKGTSAATAGGEPTDGLAWAPISEARPLRADDLVIRIPTARSPAPLRVELRNRSSDPIRVSPAWLHVSVFRDGARLRGCSTRPPRPLEGVEAIGAGESVFTTVALPCALERSGVYRVVIVVLAPSAAPASEEPRAPEPGDALASGQGVVVVP